MGATSKIEWTDATWEPITGCTLVSDGCCNCYAAELAAGRMQHHPSMKGLARRNAAGVAKFTGEVRFNEGWLTQPLRWHKPMTIFTCSRGDLFHPDVPDRWIDAVFAVMALSPQHFFRVLTKRPERMRAYLRNPETARRVYELACDMALDLSLKVILIAHPSHERLAPRGRRVHLGQWPLPNVGLGVSVEDQATADERIPPLLATPAAMRFVSAEPLLGSVDLTPWLAPDEFCEGCDDGEGYGNRCSSKDIPRSEQCPFQRAVQIVTEHEPYDKHGTPAAVICEVMTLDEIIIGGESGKHARPMHPDWARELRDQCAEAGAAFFFKQWGEWRPPLLGEPFDTASGRAQPRPAFIVARDGTVHCFHNEQTSDGAEVMTRVGKKEAGALLDGRAHLDVAPQVAAHFKRFKGAKA